MNQNLAILMMVCAYASLPHVYCGGDFQCIGTCYSGRVTPEPEDIVYGKHLKGYSYKNITTNDLNKCYSSCIQDCRCKACQMKDTRCELLDEDKSKRSADFVAASRYVYYDLRQTMYHRAYHMLPPGKCYNGCCRSQPCKNGGTCTEHCQNTKFKFSCECPKGFWGKVCENKLTSCLSVFKTVEHGEVPLDGVYNIFNTVTGTTLPHYCSFNIKHMRFWTLIESASLANSGEFLNKPFYDNTSINTLSPPSWDRYRLSPEAIRYVRSKATLFRVTCNFYNVKEFTFKTGFLLGKLSDVDITSPKESFGGHCKKYLNIRIKNHKCSECTAATYGHDKLNPQHLHIDVTWKSGCTFKPPLKRDGNYFGYYVSDEVDSTFPCSKNSGSTTQWWLGEEG